MENSRREFLKAAPLLAAASTTARAQRRVIGANDAVHFGVIGLGNIAHGNIRGLQALKGAVRITAVCDIYKPHLEWGKSVTGAKGYHDYHDLLADSNVDAVLICTPDHWHAQMSIDAMRAGKDVDVEKPMSRTIEEARQMVQVSGQTGRLLAVDSEHTAHGIWKPAQQAVKGGVLGKLVWSQTSRSRNMVQPPWEYEIDNGISPQNLDWDRFQGSASKKPFDPVRFFRWRRYWEYSGGIATDLYVHHITPLVKVTGPEFPVRVTGTGGNWVYPVNVLEVPDTLIVTMNFPSGHTMVVGGSNASAVELPIVVRGHEAAMYFHGPDQRRPAYMTIEPEVPFAENFREKVAKAGLEGKWIEQKEKAPRSNFRRQPPERQTEMIGSILGDADVKAEFDAAVAKDPALQKDAARRVDFFARIFDRQAQQSAARPFLRIDSPPSESFYENLVRCIHTREKPVLDGRLGFMAQVGAVLGNESYRQDRVMFFDPEQEKVVDRPVRKKV